MTPILFNAILCSALLVAVLGLLIWAIVTAHRDQPPAAARATRSPRHPEPRPQPSHRTGRSGSRGRRPVRPSSSLSS